jgi:hypothetical protein
MVLKKENQIYKRQINHKKVHNSLQKRERLLLTLVFKLSRKATSHLIIVQPSTLLDWQRSFIKNFWTFKHKTPDRLTNPGSSPVLPNGKKLRDGIRLIIRVQNVPELLLFYYITSSEYNNTIFSVLISNLCRIASGLCNQSDSGLFLFIRFVPYHGFDASIV